MNPNIKDKKCNYWFITLTESNGLSDDKQLLSVEYFKNFEYVLVFREMGKSNTNPHLHVFLSCTISRSDYLRRKILKTVYGYNQKDEVPPNMLKVEKVKDVTKVINYISKDNPDKPLLMQGYDNVWLQRQLEKKFDDTRFFITWKYVKVDQAPGCILEYAKLHNLTVNDKEEFIIIMKKIMKECINVRSWKKDMEWIYSQTLLLTANDDSAADMWVRNTLNFLP